MRAQDEDEEVADVDDDDVGRLCSPRMWPVCDVEIVTIVFLPSGWRVICLMCQGPGRAVKWTAFTWCWRNNTTILYKYTEK